MRSVRIALWLLGSALATCTSDSQDQESSQLPALTAERSLPSGEPYRIVINRHCGVGYFSPPVNDGFWIADEANLEPDWIPSEWADTLGPGDDLITVEVVLSADGTELTATTAGRSVVYRQMTAADPVLECA